MIAAAWKKNDSLKCKGHFYSGKKTEDYLVLGLLHSEHFSFRIHELISMCKNIKKKRIKRSFVY